MWADAARQAFVSLRRRPGQSALTVLGLTIGVASFIAIVAFAEGARGSVMAQFESLGTGVVYVNSRIGTTTPKLKPARPLTDDDVVALRRGFGETTLVTPYLRRLTEVRLEGRSAVTTMLQGSRPEFFTLRDWPAERGGLFVESDETARANLCVLGRTPARALFGEADPVGRSMKIGRSLHCTVVGVLAPKGVTSVGVDQDDILHVPVRTFMTEYGFDYGYNSIGVGLPDGTSASEGKRLARHIVRRSHGLEADEGDDFAINSPDDLQRVASNTSVLLRNLLAGVALISLLVGGIGIMNMLLVAVTARTQEIGIRLAIGAPPSAVRMQFLAEAFVLSLVGTAVGVALGALAATTVADGMGFARALDAQILALGALFGVGVGTAFGIIPARNASLLDPIVALRHE